LGGVEKGEGGGGGDKVGKPQVEKANRNFWEGCFFHTEGSEVFGAAKKRLQGDSEGIGGAALDSRKEIGGKEDRNLRIFEDGRKGDDQGYESGDIVLKRKGE